MIINNFSSYFEILTGVNLGFAAFNYFKEDLNIFLHNFILHNKKYIELSSTIYALTAEGANGNEKLVIYCEKIENTKETLIEEAKSEQRFVNHLEPLSLLLGLYCIFLLVIGGFQQEGLLIESEVNDIIITFSTIIAIFSYLVFCGSFIIRFIINDIKISFGGVVFCFIFILFFSIIISLLSIVAIFKLILLIGTPILLYTSFIAYLLFTRKLSNKVNEKYKSDIYGENELKKLKLQNNILFSFSSFITLVILISPVALCFICTKSNFNNLVIHFITLTLPMLLFVFFFIRALRSKFKIKNLSDRFHSTYSNQLKGAEMMVS